MVSTNSQNILISLFKETGRIPNGLSKRQFMAMHHDAVAEVERLIESGDIRCRDGQHLRLPLVGLATLARTYPSADSVFYLCGHLFDVLRDAFIRDPDQKRSVAEIAVLADMPKHQVAKSFGYLFDAPIWDSWSQDSDGFHTQILMSENILRYKTLSDVIEFLKGIKSPARRVFADTDSEQELRNSSEWDAFISHASEDKDAFVRPLAKALEDQGLRIWYDEWTLTVGDSLRRSIDRGLAKSRFGIVIISPHFLRKEWPQKELDGLVAREVDGVKVILPVWHGIAAAQIRESSPLLADRLAASSIDGLEKVTEKLLEAIRRDRGSKFKAAVSGEHEVTPPGTAYADYARADIDFPIIKGDAISGLVKQLRSHTWPVQNPAVKKVLSLDWDKVSPDELFVLGRNLYQTADGGEREAVSVLKDFRRHAASMPADRAVDLLNGMFFEIYFNSNGEFRGSELKDRLLKDLLKLQGVKKFSPSISFIRHELKPYWSGLRSDQRPEDPPVRKV